MSLELTTIARCFAGEIPSIIATSSVAGVPNLAHLSQVFLIDADHVGISNQFFGKTAANLAENPFATLMVVDPEELISYKLLVRHEGSENSGQRFEMARQAIDAIASLTGMEATFALRSVDVFRVLEATLVPSRGTVGLA